MTVIYNFDALRELMGCYRSGEQAARDRGDTAAARGNREAAEGLMRQVKLPRLLPDNLDDLLVQRAEAHVFAMHAAHRTALPYAIAARQGDYARRLDAVIDARDKT